MLSLKILSYFVIRIEAEYIVLEIYGSDTSIKLLQLPQVKKNKLNTRVLYYFIVKLFKRCRLFPNGC